MYVANSLTKSVRKRGEDVHNRVNPLHQPLIAIPKLLKSLSLVLEYGFDGIDRATSFQIGSEQMVEEWFPCLLLVLAHGAAQAGIKY